VEEAFYSIMAPESFFHTALLNSRLHFSQSTQIRKKLSHNNITVLIENNKKLMILKSKKNA
jgi:hypothetical protein